MDTSPLAPWLDQIHTGECLSVLGELPDGEVDLAVADLPYGKTRNKWDSPIDLNTLWAELHRVTKKTAAIALTATQPFTSTLVHSNLAGFRHEWIWHKTVPCGQLNVARMPLGTHESILVFYRAAPTYNPQMTEGTPYTARRKGGSLSGRGYGSQVDHEVVNTGKRHPRSVITVPNPRVPRGHPSQKPVKLIEHLILTYSNPGDIVLDPVIGSGTTAVAARRTGRHYIGIEKDDTWAAHARTRVAAEITTSPSEPSAGTGPCADGRAALSVR